MKTQRFYEDLHKKTKIYREVIFMTPETPEE